MAYITCELTDNAKEAVDRLLADESSLEPAAVVLKCSKSMKPPGVVVEEELTDPDLDEVRADMKGCIRFFVYRCGKQLAQDQKRYVPATICVWFNPMSAPPDIKNMYKRTLDNIVREWRSVQQFQINNPNDFNDHWFETHRYASFINEAKGSLSAHLHGEEETPAESSSPVSPSAAAFCPNCGTATVPGARFCAGCGGAL